MQKNGCSQSEITETPGEKLPKQWLDFAKALDICLPEGKAVSFGSMLYWAPAAMPSVRGIRVLRPGLELGEVKKDRFEPSHALALWLKSAKNCEDLPCDSDTLRAYMHGETIPTTKKGWCLVTADGYSIGWGKGDGQILKNHYPKGLRR